MIKLLFLALAVGIAITLILPIIKIGPFPIKFSQNIKTDRTIKGMPFVYFGILDMKNELESESSEISEFYWPYFFLNLIVWSIIIGAAIIFGLKILK